MESPQRLRIQGNENLQRMMAGAMFRKVKSRSSKKQRHFKLKEDCATVGYQSSWTKMSNSSFSVCDVEVVREGHQSEVLQSLAHEFAAECCFTLVFRGRRGNLDLVAETAEEAQAWIQGLRALMENMESMDERERLDQWICDWFVKADKNKDGRMNFKEVRKLLKMMSMDINEQHAMLLFKTADKSQSDTLESEEFVEFYKMLTERKDILALFQEYSSDGQKLSVCDLEDFLREEQLEGDTSQQHAIELIDRYEPSDNAKKGQAMSIDGFLMYLCSPEGSIFNAEHQGLYQDMSQPLCHYFISSSHNTYLLEDQLKGPSSVEAYIQALKRGCRCVEVDCWDGPSGEPIVYHGHTWTSKILFKDVIASVANYAFKVSEYPVIISLENHCSVEQQQVMAKHLSNILGESLLKSTLDGRVPSELPSPQDLKGKILIKGKKIGGIEDNLDEAQATLTGEVSDEDEAAEIDKDSLPPEETSQGEKNSKQSLCKELSDLVVYCKSVHFGGFEKSRETGKPYEMSSLSESKARKYIKEAGTEFVQHNTRQLTRLYPSGMRTDSSNYCPQDMWNVGCQIVALNFQTAGTEMDLNDGLFNQNSSCGYILKPTFLREYENAFDPDRPQDSGNYHPKKLIIKVVSGQQLPKLSKKEGSIVDPLVRVEIYGVPQDQSKQETKHIDNNGFNPLWNESLLFTIHTPELALVRFVVEDYDMGMRNDFIGQYTLPFTSILQGYRHIPLLSKDGTSITPSSLFVHIQTTDLA
ncbi:1-phosphatidylinositol 4,5-bisphosphate phosphodiesterase delta-4 [Clupea harengus]|uniref:Phosphoinositide phospholipase C n=1 Tax=Clupea harengus TaxID=7950 RepID=A0A6P3W875_CLUHA|nr:1-phosphatidylinositol 4,5-bisphosphate phosphodiesterase delta-4 [Clupea harengus]